jgi:SAM-dependent methyltransferase
MAVFGNYARYYDLLYRDKNYTTETNFIDQLIRQHATAASTILELGCGTGIHAGMLAEKGYHVHGVDISEEMLAEAHQRLAQRPEAEQAKLTFSPGDVRTVRVDQKFDVVISLFHVISYQTTNLDLAAAFETAKVHLKPGGLFIFDCWYGPTVLTDRPTVRVKRLQDEAIQVTRVAEPVMYPDQNWVDVNYQVFIKDLKTETVTELNESHRMRYLFTPEVNLLFAQAGFTPVASGEWLTDQPANFDTWGVYFVGRL